MERDDAVGEDEMHGEKRKIAFSLSSAADVLLLLTLFAIYH